MAFRIEKRTSAVLSALLLLASVSFAGQKFRYEARYKNMKRPGTLTITDSGVSFEQLSNDRKKPNDPHNWHWDYQDIQQLKVAPKSLTVLTYDDNKWRLNADRAYEFKQASDATFEDAYEFLKTRLDRRFVAAIADDLPNALWQIPVKHLVPLGSDDGVLQAGADEIVYKSAKMGESRTWRYKDIDNISSSGPFQLTITTFERARMHYASLKAFNFQLKQELEQARYDDFWLRLNQSKGLTVLNTYRR